MKRRVMCFLMCLIMVFSIVCFDDTVVKADEYMTLAELAEKLSWTGISDDFLNGSLATEYPYYLVFRSYSGTKYRTYVVRFKEKPVEVYNMNSGTSFFKLGFISSKGTYMSYYAGYTCYFIENSYSLDGKIENIIFGSTLQDGTFSLSGYTWNNDKNIICYMNFDLDFSGFSEYLTFDDSFVYVSHEHEWSDEWSNDETYHWHVCGNSDGLCDLTKVSGMDGYAEHVYDDDLDVDCNTCGYIRETIVPDITPEVTPDITPELTPDVTPEVTPDVSPTETPTPTLSPTPTNTPTPTPTPRPTATPTPTPPPFLPGGPDEDGNWVGYTEFEANSLNFLQDIKGLLQEVLWQLKNVVALLFVLVCFELLRMGKAWVKGGTKGARSS